MKEPAPKKVAAVMKEAAAAVKNETAQASCRRRPSPPPLVWHILNPCAYNQTSPLSNTLRSKAPGSWWRIRQSTKGRSRRADAAPVTLLPPLARPIHIGPTSRSRPYRHHILSSRS